VQLQENDDVITATATNEYSLDNVAYAGSSGQNLTFMFTFVYFLVSTWINAGY